MRGLKYFTYKIKKHSQFIKSTIDSYSNLSTLFILENENNEVVKMILF